MSATETANERSGRLVREFMDKLQDGNEIVVKTGLEGGAGGTPYFRKALYAKHDPSIMCIWVYPKGTPEFEAAARVLE